MKNIIIPILLTGVGIASEQAYGIKLPKKEAPPATLKIQPQPQPQTQPKTPLKLQPDAPKVQPDTSDPIDTLIKNGSYKNKCTGCNTPTGDELLSCASCGERKVASSLNVAFLRGNPDMEDIILSEDDELMFLSKIEAGTAKVEVSPGVYR